jgi:hypothetical protein
MQEGLSWLRAPENIFVFQIIELMDRAVEVYERITEHRTDTVLWKINTHKGW